MKINKSNPNSIHYCVYTLSMIYSKFHTYIKPYHLSVHTKRLLIHTHVRQHVHTIAQSNGPTRLAVCFICLFPHIILSVAIQIKVHQGSHALGQPRNLQQLVASILRLKCPCMIHQEDTEIKISVDSQTASQYYWPYYFGSLVLSLSLVETIIFQPSPLGHIVKYLPASYTWKQTLSYHWHVHIPLIVDQ